MLLASYHAFSITSAGVIGTHAWAMVLLTIVAQAPENHRQSLSTHNLNLKLNLNFNRLLLLFQCYGVRLV